MLTFVCSCLRRRVPDRKEMDKLGGEIKNEAQGNEVCAFAQQ